MLSTGTGAYSSKCECLESSFYQYEIIVTVGKGVFTRPGLLSGMSVEKFGCQLTVLDHFRGFLNHRVYNTLILCMLFSQISATSS
jgi:hypothetical protein